jgi:hypothetical protein
MKFGVFGGLVAALIIVLLIVAYGTLLRSIRPAGIAS